MTPDEKEEIVREVVGRLQQLAPWAFLEQLMRQAGTVDGMTQAEVEEYLNSWEPVRPEETNLDKPKARRRRGK